MIQGTTSNAGKSTVVAGLCRILMQRGWRVAPFKPQNMALNSAVTMDNGEIGRAQALQAQACGIEPISDMNPVLLKPNSDTGSQVIVQGKVLAELETMDYYHFKSSLMQPVLESFHRLSSRFDCIMVEGAGSPAEINLRQGDIANMGFAEAIDCPVILVADIERGGAFAHIVGTLALLSKSENTRVKGIIINRFRGNFKLLEPGLNWLEEYTGKSVLGVLPHIPELLLDAEDSLSRTKSNHHTEHNCFHVVVPLLPHISNDTDFAPLAAHPLIDLKFVNGKEPFPKADLIVLPGSKSVSADLNWLKKSGLDNAIYRHLRYGGKVIGICGGFQMLGSYIHDPLGIESHPGSCSGLDLLELETHMSATKQLNRIEGKLSFCDATVCGYEIHMGVSSGKALERPAVLLEDKSEGAISADNLILGTYLHGIFDHPESLKALLSWSGMPDVQPLDYRIIREEQLNLLAQTIEEHLDLRSILNLLEAPADLSMAVN